MSSVGNYKCEVTSHQDMNKSKGIIYMSEFDIEDIIIIQEGLVDFSAVGVEPATWIKHNHSSTRGLSPNHQSRISTRVCKDSRRGTKNVGVINRDQCTARNVNNTDTINCCRAEYTMCGRCATIVHGSDACEAADLCTYAAWNRKCRENLFQSEVVQVMDTQKLQRFDAPNLVRLCYSTRTTSYATVARAGFLDATIETLSIVQQPTQARALSPIPANHEIIHSENEMDETRASKRRLEVENE